MSSLKRTIYISLFTLFGALLGFFIHMVSEILYINFFLLNEFATYSLGLPWENILLVHLLFTLTLTLGFGLLGFYQGRYWWRVLYVEGGYKRLRNKLFGTS